MRKIFVNLILVAISIVLISFISEAVLRYYAYHDDKKILSEKILSSRSPKDNSVVFIQQTIKLSNNKDVIYELKSDLKVHVIDIWKNPVTRKFLDSKNYLLRTDSDGFRCSWRDCIEYTETYDEGTIRILGIGDSIMYGDGVQYKEAYLSRLQQRLSGSFTDAKWEVINMAAIGYNAAMEVAYLKEKGLKYNPDIVIVGYCTNDYNLPNFIRNKQDYFTLSKSYLYELVSERLGIVERTVKNRVEFQLADINIDDPEKVPSEYKHMVGWEGYAKSMRLLKKMSDENKFEVVMVFFTSFFGTSERDKKARDLSEELGFQVVDIDPLVEQYMADNNIKVFRGSKLSINKYDPHPSAMLHDMASEEIYRQLIAQGLIDKILRAKMN